MESSFKNPFDPEYALTSLEKRALERGADGTGVGNLGKTTTQKKSNVIMRGVLSVTVVAAEDLPAVDLMGKADPFVVLTMKKSETKARTRVRFKFSITIIIHFFKLVFLQKKSIQPNSFRLGRLVILWTAGPLCMSHLNIRAVVRTNWYKWCVYWNLGTLFSLLSQVLNSNLNPVWNQTFDFVVEDVLHDMLIAEVWDHDTFGKVNFLYNFSLQNLCLAHLIDLLWFCQDKIGRVILTLTRVVVEGEFQDSFPLEGAKSGKLHLHLKWTPEIRFRDS